mgnify:CR=1 FL=1|tara:strand:- start:899 stop:1786 length:888 start_codon:yes stop_codon:yes gene_type:complete
MLEEIENSWNSIKEVLEFNIISIAKYHLSIYNLILLVFIVFITRFLVSFLERTFRERVSNKKWITEGKQNAIIQIGKYIIYIIAILLATKTVGVNITPILIGSSALFVGLGFGLQDAFRDFISGLILLFEGDVVVGDIIEFENGLVAVVKKIKLRTSKVRTRDGISILVPNSELINNRVINWSNSNILTRFNVEVGVSYGSDVRLVEKLLLEAATDDPSVSQRAKPFVRFADFGDSSLDFEVHFWTEEVWKIETTKSRIRFAIDEKFRTNNITIPFPQRDVHFKSSDVSLRPQND